MTDTWDHSNSDFGQWLEEKMDIHEWDTSYFPLLQARWPFFLSTMYLLTVLILQPSRKQEAKTKASGQKRGAAFTAFVFFHNVFLFLFSIITFARTLPITFRLMSELGWRGASCGGWRREYSGEFGFWVFAFYLSKYYEFIDTWILIAKGRRPSFLQVFHHIGAVFSLWWGVASKANGMYLFLNLNSFIHSWMYLYYACSTVNIRWPKTLKAMITRSQMIQFVVGNSIVLPQVYLHGDCSSWVESACSIYNVVYTSFLLILFNMFFARTYKKRKPKARRE